MHNTIRIAIAGAALCAAGLASAADIAVKVDGVSDKQGTVRLMLFDAASWPHEPNKEVGVPAVPGSTTVVMKDVAPGEYVVVAYHDKDGDGRLGMDGQGIPFEPFAISKNPQIDGAPPDFDQASFKLTDKNYSETVKLRSMP